MATKKTQKAPVKTSPQAKKITDEDIRKKAQEIYEARIAKGVEGDSETDWHQAERELKKKK